MPRIRKKSNAIQALKMTEVQDQFQLMLTQKNGSHRNVRTNFCYIVHRVVILEEATYERKQINKYHWLMKVLRAHFIGRERFPKHHFLVF